MISKINNNLNYRKAAITVGSVEKKYGIGVGYCASTDTDIDDLIAEIKERILLSNGSLPATAGHDWTDGSYILNAIPALPNYAQWLTIMQECDYWLKTSSYLYNKANTWVNSDTHAGGDIDGATSITYFVSTDYTSQISSSPSVTWINNSYGSGGGYVWTMGGDGGLGTVDAAKYGDGDSHVDSNAITGVFCTLLGTTIARMILAVQKLIAITSVNYTTSKVFWYGTASGPASSHANNVSCISSHHPTNGDNYTNGNTCSGKIGPIAEDLFPCCRATGQGPVGGQYWLNLQEAAYNFNFTITAPYLSAKCYMIFRYAAWEKYVAPQMAPTAQAEKYAFCGNGVTVQIGSITNEWQSVLNASSSSVAGYECGWACALTDAIAVVFGDFVI